MSKCPKCGSRDIDFLEAGGQSICVSCGTVLEESTIVSSIEFQETGDRSHVIGQYVSANCSKPYMAGSRLMGRHMDVRDGKEASLLNARRTITQVASTLRLPPLYIDRAYRLYQLALQRNFTFGRRQTHVVATCLYIICRQEKSPHLLIDFSDALQVNVYVLGKAFLQFTRVLNLNLPVVDPSLYIHRYASKLDFGEKMNVVVTTTLRIVTRLKKDWIAIGRRPDGVCAAALLIAARAHGFHVSQENIALLFRIAQDTLRRRLVEFKNTPSAQLNLQQFHLHDMELEYDPPSFINNTLLEHGGENVHLIVLEEEEEGKEGGEGSSVVLEAKELMKDEVYNTLQDTDDEEEGQEGEGEPVILHAHTAVSTSSSSSTGRFKSMKIHANLSVDVPLPSLNKSRKTSSSQMIRHEERLALYDDIYTEVYDSTVNKDSQVALIVEAQDVEQHPQAAGGWGSIKQGRKKEHKLIIHVDVSAKAKAIMDKEQEDEVDEEIVPLDDTEVNHYLLTEEESTKRAAIWDKTYGAFMEERARRKREREKTEENNANNTGDKYTQSGKLRKKYTRKTNPNHSNASDAAMASRANVKGASKKINYDALKGVFGGDGAFAVPSSSSASGSGGVNEVGEKKQRGMNGGVTISKPNSTSINTGEKKETTAKVTAATATQPPAATGAATTSAIAVAEDLEEDEEEEDMLLYEDDGQVDYDDEYY